MVTADTILNLYGTIMPPLPPKSPLKLYYKNRKEQHQISLPSCNFEKNAKKIYSYYYMEKCSGYLLHATYIKSQKFLLYFIHSARRSTGSPVGKGAFLSTLYLNTSL